MLYRLQGNLESNATLFIYSGPIFSYSSNRDIVGVVNSSVQMVLSFLLELRVRLCAVTGAEMRTGFVT